MGSLVKDGRVQGGAGVGVLIGFAVGLLVSGKPWHLPPAWGDIPTWISAAATIGLLIGAIVTARYAIKAFGKQSEQLKDQRGINELQAKDLEASLVERKRLREVAERDQANDVGFAWWPASHVLIINPPAQSPSSTPRHPEAVTHADTSGMAVLVGGSARRLAAASAAAASAAASRSFAMSS